MFVLIFFIVVVGGIFLAYYQQPLKVSVKDKSNIEEMKEWLETTNQNESIRRYISSQWLREMTISTFGKDEYLHGTYSSEQIWYKIDKLKESSFGQCAIAYEQEIYSLALTLSSHRQDGIIEILPENIESFLKTISSIYDILCHKEKEVQAEEESERLEWVKFGEEASNKVGRTMELIKEDLKAESRVDLEKEYDLRQTNDKSNMLYKDGSVKHVFTSEFEKIRELLCKIQHSSLSIIGDLQFYSTTSGVCYNSVCGEYGLVESLCDEFSDVRDSYYMGKKISEYFYPILSPNFYGFEDDRSAIQSHDNEVIIENSFNQLDTTVLNAGGMVFDGINTYSHISDGKLVKVECTFGECGSIVKTKQTVEDVIDNSNIFKVPNANYKPVKIIDNSNDWTMGSQYII